LSLLYAASKVGDKFPIYGRSIVAGDGITEELKLVVAVKQVGVVSDEFEIAADGMGVAPEDLDFTMNEWDAYALEAALSLGEEQQAEVIAVTVGSENTEPVLRRALAMGATRAVRLDTNPVDALSAARAIAGFVRAESPDLVLCGVQSADAANGATGPAVAELCGLPWVAVVRSVDPITTPASLRVTRELDAGVREVVDVELPALLTIQSGINEPRYATLRAIKNAEREPIEVVACDSRPASHLRRVFVPAPQGENAESLGDDPAVVAERIIEIVRGTEVAS
jgi:electron transfer flavoprotein beta subunit